MVRALPAAPALACAAFPVAARDPPLVALVFGNETLEAHAGDVVKARPVEQSGRPAVSIRLSSALDRPLAHLTGRHIGKEGEVLLCGTVLSRPRLMDQLPVAQFLIFVDSAAEAERLSRLLNKGTCDPSP